MVGSGYQLGGPDPTFSGLGTRDVNNNPELYSNELVPDRAQIGETGTVSRHWRTASGACRAWRIRRARRVLGSSNLAESVFW